MISYFKYTNNDAFLLNGSNYEGFIHKDGSDIYTDKVDSIYSELLSSKNTFMNNVLKYGYNFNTTYRGISTLNYNYSNAFDLINKKGFDKMIYNIDLNNIICYISLVLGNPTVFNYEENDGHFYGFTRASDDSVTGIPYKNGYGSIEPFTNIPNWSWVDDITVGDFVVDTNENFKYMCADTLNTYILGGSFSNNSEMILLDTIQHEPYYNITHNIYSDDDNSKIVFIKNDTIEIYDSSNYDTCDELILVDFINLLPTTTTEYIWGVTEIAFDQVRSDVTFSTKYSTENPNNPEYIKFGKNIRTNIVGDFLYIINKYSSDTYNTITLSKYGVVADNILDLDVRGEDDAIIILENVNGSLYINFFDPTDIDGTFSRSIIRSIDATISEQHIEFSKIDSDIFYVYNSKEYQTRNLSNPQYPSGRLEGCDLSYLNNLIWDTTDEMYQFVDIPWDGVDFLSNYYNSITNSRHYKNGKMYMILHNIGRIYALNQPLNERFLNKIPLTLEKYFNGTEYSESSMGLSFNSALSNILKDTLNLFNKAESSFTILEREVLSKDLSDVIVNVNNLYLNGNETMNVVALQRITTLITNIQKKILPVSG